jgi:sigma-B regulation protein RsbU (phosphoserine phosphatase)
MPPDETVLVPLLSSPSLARDAEIRALLDHTTAVIYIKDAQGRYEFVNRTFTELFNIDTDEIVGKTDRDIFPREFADAFGVNDRQVVATGKQVRCEEVAPHGDGPHTYFSVKVPLFDDAGKVRAVAGISTDMTDHFRARAADEELRLARLVQQRLYPSRAPQVDGFDIAGASLPMAQLCGDYFDFVFNDERDHLYLAVGDVSGHGLAAALKMVELRAILRLLLGRSRDLAATVEQLNQMLRDDSPESYFVTLFLLQIEIATRRIRYCGAGHDAWIVSHEGEARQLPSTTFPLGIKDLGGITLDSTITTEGGDMMILFTDGLTDATDSSGQSFGTQRVLEVVRQLSDKGARRIVDGLLAGVRDFAGSQGLRDDVTVIVAKVR